MSRLRLSCALCTLVLAGCALGPDYVRPQIAAPAQYKETDGWSLAAPADHIPRTAWWTVFDDPDLDRLEAQLDRNNPTIIEAEAQYRQAIALLQEAQAGFFPTIGANVGAGKSRSIGSSNNGNGSNGVVAQSYTASLSASWEVDLWGGVRRAIEAGKASEAASAANLANIKLSEQAALAIAYLELYVSDNLKRVADETVAAYQQQLQIEKNNFAVGVAGEADVLQVQNALETAQVQAGAQSLQRDELEHSIAVLVGESPSSFSIGVRSRAPHLPVIPAGVPSQLLQRRPDIAQAERQVAEANAEIGVAKAAFFPTLTLSASDGFSASSLANWFSMPSRVWSVGPALAGTLFDGGLRRAQSDAAIAAYDQNVANYRQTVLTAFQSVEDNLAAQRILREEARHQHQAVDAAHQSARITLNQYHAGTVGMLNVLEANVTLLSNQSSEFGVLNNQLTTAVGLIKALGGGYQQPGS
jgi:NodT family efflux transporter outer membrane factor (OMF) lipoprotein